MGDRHSVMVALNAHVEKVVVALTINTHANLVEATPVDTGWARANWIPSLGTPAVSVVGAPDAPDTSAAEGGLKAVLAFKLADGAVFVSNRVPYIRRLDAGTSDQAPAGFVRYAISKAILDSGNGRLVA